MKTLMPVGLALVIAAATQPVMAQTNTTLANTAQAAATSTPTATPAPATYGAPISLAQAEALIDRAVAASQARGFRMAVAVVEPSGELVAFVRMDDTQYGSIYIAQRKAETAARYRGTTAAMEARVLGGRTVSLANADSLPIAGGVPIVIDGKIVGAIGVSGAAASDDHEIAQFALSQVPLSQPASTRP